MTRRLGVMAATALLTAALSGCIYVGGARHYHEDDDYYNRDRYNDRYDSSKYDSSKYDRYDRNGSDRYQRNDSDTYDHGSNYYRTSTVTV